MGKQTGNRTRLTALFGGVSILNIMLASSNACVRETGIRTALGVTCADVRLQFLTEAVIILLAGTIVKALVGLAVPLVVHFFTDYAIPISIWSIVIGLTAAALLGRHYTLILIRQLVRRN